ncbi:hypothetical protein ACFV5G_09565 [Streptomyces sp. NPDC059766]|uniref:hypothetical protein n=1 Tax=Streptomyces sp. NPDC059766 TaxID=3346940 RepID=UPI00364A0DF8
MTASNLGPLELIADVWIIGDPTARKSKHFRLQQQGLSYWIQGVQTQVIPWSRFMNLVLSVQPTRLGNSRAMAMLSAVTLAPAGGAREAFLGATLRDPYEDWSEIFTHPARKFGRRDIRKAEEFLKQTVEFGRARKLGDPLWVSQTVEKIAGLTVKPRDMKAAIGEIVKS